MGTLRLTADVKVLDFSVNEQTQGGRAIGVRLGLFAPGSDEQLDKLNVSMVQPNSDQKSAESYIEHHLKQTGLYTDPA